MQMRLVYQFFLPSLFPSFFWPPWERPRETRSSTPASAPVPSVEPGLKRPRCGNNADGAHLGCLRSPSPRLTTVVSHDPSLLSNQVCVFGTIRNQAFLASAIPKWREIRSINAVHASESCRLGSFSEALERAVAARCLSFPAANVEALSIGSGAIRSPLLAFVGRLD